MTNIPAISGKKTIKTLQKFGFNVIRIKGSHHFIRHPDGRSTVVPVHRNEIIGKGLFYKILKDCEISGEDFIKML